MDELEEFIRADLEAIFQKWEAENCVSGGIPITDPVLREEMDRECGCWRWFSSDKEAPYPGLHDL